MDLLERVCVDAGAVFSYVTDDLAEGRMLLQARRAVLPSLEVLGTWLTDDVCVPRTEMAALIAACERISGGRRADHRRRRATPATATCTRRSSTTRRPGAAGGGRA